MKIINNTLIQNNSKVKGQEKQTPAQYTVQTNSTDDIPYSKISFGAIHGVKKKKTDIEAEKNKLLKQLNEILESNTADIDPDDLLINELCRNISIKMAQLDRMEKLIDQASTLQNNRTLSPQLKLEALNRLKKEFKKVSNEKLTPEKKAPKTKNDENTDFALLNKFKQAISQDNFELEKIYNDHYKELKNVTNIKELKIKYPHIKIPQRPELTIAEKIESILTKDFYVGLDNVKNNQDNDYSTEYISKKIIPMLEEIADNYKLDKKKFLSKTFLPTLRHISNCYKKLAQKDSINSVPENKKIKKPQITKDEAIFATVDFEKFVLDVVKKQYLDGEKINNIVYKEDNTQLQAGTLKIFDKISEKTKVFIRTAKALKAAQRDYELFNKDELKARLNLLADGNIINNAELFSACLAFDKCNYTEDDIPPLIKFLRELDNIHDEQKTCEDVAQIVKKENLTPRGTIKLDEIETQKIAEQIKQEQLQKEELDKFNTQFGDAINLLYMNNLNKSAMACEKYRPKVLTDENKAEAEFLIDLIKKYTNSDDYRITNKTKVESEIIRRDIFNKYKNNEPNSEVFQAAINYAKDENGNVNKSLAGKYILNYEIITTAPESLEYVKKGDLIAKILEKNLPKSDAIKYLCKLDDYHELTPKERTQITKITELFDTKDEIDKLILKDLVLNEYANTDTKIKTFDRNNGNLVATSNFNTTAKQAICDKYKFPTCIKFFEDFETAMTITATEEGSSGVKSTTRNNKKQKYKIEVKISGENDRLFSSQNDYDFDIFDDKGMHRS